MTTRELQRVSQALAGVAAALAGLNDGLDGGLDATGLRVGGALGSVIDMLRAHAEEGQQLVAADLRQLRGA